MKSMTGYGVAKVHSNDIDLEIELKSVNGRYLDLRLYLPREISFFEHILRKQIAATLKRGTVEARINFTDHREPRLLLNKAKLEKYHAIVEEAASVLGMTGQVSLEFLLNEPGIIENANNLDEDRVLNAILHNTLDKALANLVKSLSAEADNITQVLSDSYEHMLEALSAIEAQIKPYKEELFESMKTRTAELLNSFCTENLEQRLIQELAIYIDRYDIQEEISRLRSHISTLLSAIEKDEDNGKTLNFILQEMQREANTLGSKFSTTKTYTHILILKEEVEKCREIVQNVA